jgi:hypothetical protein
MYMASAADVRCTTFTRAPFTWLPKFPPPKKNPLRLVRSVSISFKPLGVIEKIFTFGFEPATSRV